MREWHESDIEPFAQMCADPNVMRYFPSVMTHDECAQFVEREMQRGSEGFCRWVVGVDGSFAGFTGLAQATYVGTFTPCEEVKVPT